MKEKPSRSELSRRAWANPETRRRLLEGAKKASITRMERFPKKRRMWVCKNKDCELEVLSAEKPGPRTWGRGDKKHTCHFKLKRSHKK
ncbi:MAG: hypothetical protein ACXAD7_27875 [Candidatus Kariarchaeaceae archaeon]|jgi:hypothetical protein